MMLTRWVHCTVPSAGSAPVLVVEFLTRRRYRMRLALRSVIAMAAICSLLSLPARVHAQRAAIQIVSVYMTTEQAYEAYNSSNAAAPPMVEAFPQGVASVGFYLHYRGATVKASYRVGFVRNGTEVRHGALHSFDRAA